MVTKKETPKMSETFQEIFKKYRPGVDFLILDEKEGLTYLDEFGRPEGDVMNLSMDFDGMAKNREDGFTWCYNSGCYAAFDYATKTYICTARPDVISADNGFSEYSESGLYVALRCDMAMGPADPGKLAAWKYQEAVADMKHKEKEALKANSTLKKVFEFGKEQGKALERSIARPTHRSY